MNSEIYLRPWKKEDISPLTLIANNRHIWNNVRDSLPHAYKLKDAEAWISHCRRQKPQLNFAIIYNERLAGSIGCTPQTDIHRKSMEIGYFVGEPFWNKGIAGRAVRILLNYIEKEFDVVRVFAEVFEFNKASMRVLHKNGFYLENIRRKAVIKNNRIMDDYVWVKLLGRKNSN